MSSLPHLSSKEILVFTFLHDRKAKTIAPLPLQLICELAAAFPQVSAHTKTSKETVTEATLHPFPAPQPTHLLYLLHKLNWSCLLTSGGCIFFFWREPLLFGKFLLLPLLMSWRSEVHNTLVTRGPRILR